MPSTEAYLMLSGTLFAVGLIGVVIRRNMITVLMAIELMLNAVNINLVAFSYHLASLQGQLFAIDGHARPERPSGLVINRA